MIQWFSRFCQLRRFNYILAYEDDLDANEREKPDA